MMLVVDAVKLVTRPQLSGLPDGCYVEYFGEIPGKCHFAIVRPRDEWSYTDFALLMFDNEGNARSVPVKNVVRYRDGGTTEVETVIGDFNFPTCFKPELKPTFCGEPIVVFERQAQ